MYFPHIYNCAVPTDRTEVHRAERKECKRISAPSKGVRRRDSGRHARAVGCVFVLCTGCLRCTLAADSTQSHTYNGLDWAEPKTNLKKKNFSLHTLRYTQECHNSGNYTMKAKFSDAQRPRRSVRIQWRELSKLPNALRPRRCVKYRLCNLQIQERPRCKTD